MRVLEACLACAFTLMLGVPAQAATITAASCSRSDVGNAVARATHGDTVLIPAGDCTWTTNLTVTVGIVLKGAGEGVGGTTIRDNVPKDGGYASGILRFSVNAPNTFRIANFKMVGVASDPRVFQKGHIVLDGTSKAFRVDHITTESTMTAVIRTYGYLWGVIDHITHPGNTPLPPNTFQPYLLEAGHNNWNDGKDYGDGSWADGLYLGTERAIYVENSTLTANSNPFVNGFMDGLDGARVVYRYNTFTQGFIGSHGTDTGQRRRGIRSMEIYENNFSFPVGMAVDRIVWFRGGTGVMFNNRVSGVDISGGFNALANHHNYRDNNNVFLWGLCDGTSPYDQNQPGQTGYRCVDQPGSGTSKDLAGVETPPGQWVGNIVDPIYVWNNTVNGAPNNCGTFGCGDDGHVKVGRDIIFGTARPGYTSYTYPHPLITSGPLADVPTAVANPAPIPVPPPIAPANLKVK
jgi:hypothetical protein